MNFDKESLDTSCSQCGQKHTEIIGRFQHQPKFALSNCQASICVNADELRRGIESAEKAPNVFRELRGQLLKWAQCKPQRPVVTSNTQIKVLGWFCHSMFRFRLIAPRLTVLQNAARTQRRAALDVHPHLVRVFQFPAEMARVICTACIHESLSGNSRDGSLQGPYACKVCVACV